MGRGQGGQGGPRAGEGEAGLGQIPAGIYYCKGWSEQVIGGSSTFSLELVLGKIWKVEVKNASSFNLKFRPECAVTLLVIWPTNLIFKITFSGTT